jgi:hypothetical protein
VTVDLRGAMRSYATEVSVLTTYLDEASISLAPRLVRTHHPVGDHTVAMGDTLATGTQHHARSARRRRGAARGRLNRRGTSTSNGRNVATGQPPLITNRCYKEYT